MKGKKTKNITKRLGAWAILTALILIIPLAANFPWTKGDFIFAGVVLFGCASVYEFSTKNTNNRIREIATGIAVLTVLILIWGWAVA